MNAFRWSIATALVLEALPLAKITVGELQGGARPARVVADVLKANLDSWRQTSLWDDLAALFLLRPEIFGKRGGHFEPALQQHPESRRGSASTIKLWGTWGWWSSNSPNAINVKTKPADVVTRSQWSRLVMAVVTAVV